MADMRERIPPMWGEELGRESREVYEDRIEEEWAKTRQSDGSVYSTCLIAEVMCPRYRAQLEAHRLGANVGGGDSDL